MDFETAASLPVAYLTAFVALDRLAGLQPMQSVLIHAATGGVGLASLALARASHARVFATASKPKQSFLQSLGCSDVYDSRELGFASLLQHDTEGSGVDVVVNLLDESFAEENLRCLVSGGTYIDITKPSENLAKRIAVLRPDVRYYCFDLTAMLRTDSAELMSSCASLLGKVARGELCTLPIERVPMQRASTAIRKMQRAAHLGKIVLTLDAPSSANAIAERSTDA